MIGEPIHQWTTNCSDSVAATRMTRPLAIIFATMISGATIGMTSRCSTVPCSRSRISAAPVRMTVSIVIWLMTCVIAENHAVLRFGLNAARTTRLIGAPVEASLPEMNRWISLPIAVLR